MWDSFIFPKESISDILCRISIDFWYMFAQGPKQKMQIKEELGLAVQTTFSQIFKVGFGFSCLNVQFWLGTLGGHVKMVYWWWLIWLTLWNLLSMYLLKSDVFLIYCYCTIIANQSLYFEFSIPQNYAKVLANS